MPVLKPNQLKRRLAGGRKAFGAWLHTASPMAVEVLSGVGYDALIIDNEHGPASLQATHAMLQASVPYDLGIGVRVPIGDPVYFKQLLDMGADSVMVPMIHTVDDARAVVDACRYPPKGSRGIGPWRAMANGVSIDDYRAHMAENLFIMVQIESTTAMANAEAIARVDGVDLLVIGPNDLSGSMGIVGQFDHPDHLAAMDRILAAATKAGKPCCTVPYGKFSTAALFQRGYSFVIASTEYTLMRRSALAEIADAKKAMGNG
jgi:4-hydroxy-2-oxoheptanedioate aldolase